MHRIVSDRESDTGGEGNVSAHDAVAAQEVGVRVESEDLTTGSRRHTNSCYLTFVAIDRNGRPIEVPRLVQETDEEVRRYEAAKARRRRRLEERTAEMAALTDA